MVDSSDWPTWELEMERSQSAAYIHALQMPYMKDALMTILGRLGARSIAFVNEGPPAETLKHNRGISCITPEPNYTQSIASKNRARESGMSDSAVGGRLCVREMGEQSLAGKSHSPSLRLRGTLSSPVRRVRCFTKNSRRCSCRTYLIALGNSAAKMTRSKHFQAQSLGGEDVVWFRAINQHHGTANILVVATFGSG